MTDNTDNLDELLKTSIAEKQSNIKENKPQKESNRLHILAAGIAKLSTSINLLLKGKWKMSEGELEVFQQAIEEIAIEHHISEIKAEYRLMFLGVEYFLIRISIKDFKKSLEKRTPKDDKKESSTK